MSNFLSLTSLVLNPLPSIIPKETEQSSSLSARTQVEMEPNPESVINSTLDSNIVVKQEVVDIEESVPNKAETAILAQSPQVVLQNVPETPATPKPVRGRPKTKTSAGTLSCFQKIPKKTRIVTKPRGLKHPRQALAVALKIKRKRGRPAKLAKSCCPPEKLEGTPEVILERSRDQFDAFGEYVAAKLRRLEYKTCAFVQKTIGDVVFEAEVGSIFTLMKDADSTSANGI